MPQNVDPLDWFISLFRGNQAFYTIHQPPFSVNENGKNKAAWCGFAKYGTKSFPRVPSGFEKGDFVPVTKEQYRDHLNGKAGLALAPVANIGDKRNACFYCALDIDMRGVDYSWFIRKLYGLGFKFAPFRSRSGGLHVYFFFQEAEFADRVIGALNRLVEVLALDKLYPGQVEVFPKQAAVIPGEKNANGLLLPFYNIADPKACPNRMYGLDGKLLGMRSAMAAMDGLFTSVGALEKTIDELPYRDAPYCIQALLLTGALFKEGDHRNDFLFTAALYLKLKKKSDFLSDLTTMNQRLECPLEDDAVETIYTWVTNNDYQIWGQCKKSPCKEYCNRTQCKKRSHGVGREKNNIVSDIEFGRIVEVRTKEPYYLIEVRIAGTEEYVQIRVDDTAKLMNQRIVQQECIRHLKYIPASVKQSVWEDRLNNEVLNKMEVQEVASTTDMTETSLLYKYFLRYLTHAQAKNRKPHMIVMGYVHYQDGVYSFDGDGFKAYLGNMNFRLNNINVRAELESFGCKPGKVAYKTVKGTERFIECWQKADDEKLRDMRVFYDEMYDEDAKDLDARLAEDVRRGEGTDGEDHEF